MQAVSLDQECEQACTIHLSGAAMLQRLTSAWLVQRSSPVGKRSK
jgi:hypothetical protein